MTHYAADALRRFGRHANGCNAHILWVRSIQRDAEPEAPPTADDERCDCGLRAALARIARTEVSI